MKKRMFLLAALTVLSAANAKAQDNVNEPYHLYLAVAVKEPQDSPAERAAIRWGGFTQGCINESSAPPCPTNAMPSHGVFLDSYRIDRTEVTNWQYAECVREGECLPPASPDSATRVGYYGDQRYASYPVINVTWQQAVTYCHYRNGRLPTEAEWEKAARGMNVVEHGAYRFPWGNGTPTCVLANFKDDTTCRGDTAPVGAHRLGASPYGVHDLAGNVWEWTADWYQPDAYTMWQETNPQGPPSGIMKVVRGGGWVSRWGQLAVYAREGAIPTIAADALGFRCAYGGE